ncbi:MAG: hypothetical protein ACJ76N_09555 [Thermoanaerobaculia bacterium]
MNSKHLLAAFGIASALFAAVPGKSFGAEAPPAAKPEEKTDVVTVKGPDYSLTVRTPAGWEGNVEAAKPFHGNVLFTQKGDSGSGAKILLIVQHKFDENTALLINGDINNIRKQYPNLQTAELDVKHPKYPTFTKTLSQPGQFFQYETYMNPGSLYAWALFLGMSKAKDPATPAELAAYRQIVQSLEMSPPPAAPNPG